jgi:RNA 2',3'-cyclic 3'-phosphodiesterase
MRLFVALEIPDDVKDELVALPADKGARRTKRDQLHLTLRFIGDVEQAQFAAIKNALAEVKAAPLEMQFRGVGQFPPRKQARVLWVGIAPNPALDTMQKAIETKLRGTGLTAADYPFNAHITLARIDPPQDVSRFLEMHQAFESRVMRVEQFMLFSSVLSPQGSIYRHEAVYQLG